MRIYKHNNIWACNKASGYNFRQFESAQDIKARSYMNICSFLNPSWNLFSCEPHSLKKKINKLLIIKMMWLVYRQTCNVYLYRPLPVNVQHITLLRFSFGWKVHKHWRRVQLELEWNLFLDNLMFYAIQYTEASTFFMKSNCSLPVVFCKLRMHLMYFLDKYVQDI